MRRILEVLRCLPLAVLAACAGDGPSASGVFEGASPEQAAVAVAPTSADEIQVHYLANEGFLVEGGGRRVLIDALFGAGIGGYPAAAPALRTDLERGTGDWGGIQLALATHYHGDHFDPEAVARFLAANPDAVFVSTPQAKARMSTSDAELLGRFRAILPAAGEVERFEVAGVTVDVMNLHHGARQPPVENLGFVVALGDRRFLHFGDTEAKIEDFEPYLDLLADTDLALLPFWFLSSEWRAEMVRDRIKPRWIVAAHTPLPTASAGHFGRWESYDNLLGVMSAAFPDAVIPRASAERWVFGADR